MPGVHWKTGFEIELLAPPGKSRQDLAQAIADHHHARVRRIFHVQGEPSKVPGTPIFENLTLGFAIEDNQGRLLAQCVDDLTLQDDLDARRPPRPGWYRILSDDSRLLRLTMMQANAEQPLATVLRPLARLFGTEQDMADNGMVRVSDRSGASIAMGAPLPGERERPCELITAPIEQDHFRVLNDYLKLARSLGFVAPVEGAIHIHFDAARLCHPATLANLIKLLHRHGQAIKQAFATNPHCRRLGAWPEALITQVNQPDFIHHPWHQARLQLCELKLTKYCDFNLRNLVHNTADKHTFEVRVLPVWMEAEPLIRAAAFFANALRWAVVDGPELKQVPEDFSQVWAMFLD